MCGSPVLHALFTLASLFSYLRFVVQFIISFALFHLFHSYDFKVIIGIRLTLPLLFTWFTTCLYSDVVHMVHAVHLVHCLYGSHGSHGLHGLWLFTWFTVHTIHMVHMVHTYIYGLCCPPDTLSIRFTWFTWYTWFTWFTWHTSCVVHTAFDVHLVHCPYGSHGPH